jgi:hypothetical protein
LKQPFCDFRQRAGIIRQITNFLTGNPVCLSPSSSLFSSTLHLSLCAPRQRCPHYRFRRPVASSATTFHQQSIADILSPDSSLARRRSSPCCCSTCFRRAAAAGRDAVAAKEEEKAAACVETDARRARTQVKMEQRPRARARRRRISDGAARDAPWRLERETAATGDKCSRDEGGELQEQR